jgi:adenylate cyclase
MTAPSEYAKDATAALHQALHISPGDFDAEGIAAVIERVIRNATRERDTRARRQLREAQAAAQERLARLLSASPAVIYSFKATGDFAPTFVSDNIIDVFGYAPAEYLENPSFWRDRVHADDLECVEEAISKFFQNGVHAVEYRFRRKDGSYCWVNDEQRLIGDKEGKPLEIVGSWSDITARKAAEEAKAAAHTRLSQLLTSSPAVIYSYMATGDFAPTFISKNISDWLGYEPSEYLENADFWRRCVHPDDFAAVEAESVQLFKKGRHTVEYRFLKKNGTYCWVNDAQRLIRDEKGQPAEVVGSWSDITERKRAEEAAAAARDRVEHLLARSPAVIYSFKATGDYEPTFISRNVRICSDTTPRNTSRVRISGEIAYITTTASASSVSIRGYLTRGASAPSTDSARRMAATVGSATSCSCCATRQAIRSRWWARGTTSRRASRSAKPWSPRRTGSDACCRLRLR